MQLATLLKEIESMNSGERELWIRMQLDVLKIMSEARKAQMQADCNHLIETDTDFTKRAFDDLFPLTERTAALLRRAEILTLGDLLFGWSVAMLMEIPDFGPVSLGEVQYGLDQFGLCLWDG